MKLNKIADDYCSNKFTKDWLNLRNLCLSKKMKNPRLKYFRTL